MTDTVERSLQHWSEAGRAGMDAFYTLATEDYRQLALALDWPAVLTAVAAGRERIRLLDVACGSGKFPAALLEHGGLAAFPTLETDLLDPAAFSLAEARRQLRPPFVGAADHECTLQDLDVPPGSYDVLWSTHGLYALPAADVVTGMQRFVTALDPVGGFGAVAQATARSHYLVFDDVFRRSFDDGTRTAYTGAEQVVAALDALGVPHAGPTLHYETSVAVEDRAVAEGFLQRCAFDDSVSLERMLADEGVGGYLRSCERDGRWVFRHEVRLITLGPRGLA